MSSICACVCARVYSKCAGLDLHTLLLIKRTRRQSGVSATPGGMEVSGGRGVTVSMCAFFFFFESLSVVCLHICHVHCMLEKAASCVSLSVFHCQTLVHFGCPSMHLHLCV